MDTQIPNDLGFRDKDHREQQKELHRQQRLDAPDIAVCALCNISGATANMHRHHHTSERRHNLVDGWVWVHDHCHRSIHRYPASAKRIGLL